MKNFPSYFTKIAAIFLLSAMFFISCQSNERPSPDALDKDTSYAFGMFIAGQIGLEDFSFDYQALMEGFRDYNEDRGTRFDMDEAFDLILPAIMAIQAEIDERMWLEGELYREEGEAFLAQNRTRPGVFVTPSGLQYEIIEEGTGEKPGPTDMVEVNYEGSLIDGVVFDSSYWRGYPVEFFLDEVIDGWSEGVQLMNVGSTYRLFIPSDIGYGPGGAGGVIPPFATLIFLVELVSIIR